MCGIMGYVGSRQAREILIEGLERLEYRGYDSAGIGIVNNFGKIELRRAEGKLANLVKAMHALPIYGKTGIGHTRWATHGSATERNAHPHLCGTVAVVHNGIIKNCSELKRELEACGYKFLSDTDTEVVPQLINLNLQAGSNPLEATMLALRRISGSFAVAILFQEFDDLMIVACKDSPLVIGLTDHGNMIASDQTGLAPFTESVIHLEDGDIACITRSDITIYDASGIAVTRATESIASSEIADKGSYAWFTEKEIFEQPEAIQRTLNTPSPTLPFEVKNLKRLWLIGCGTSWHAGLAMRPLFEELWKVPTVCETASEFLDREMMLAPNEAGIFLSQSGETADTLAALRWMKEKGCPTLAIVNRRGSMMSRVADGVIYLSVGQEVGVASTKAFTAQLVALARVAFGNPDFYRGDAMGQWSDTLNLGKRFQVLRELPVRIRSILEIAPVIKDVADQISEINHLMYIGRGAGNYAACLEGALKMKELSYVHAEALMAGELKHGPLALIDDKTVVVVLAPRDRSFDQMISNIQEIIARGGKVLVFSDREGCASLAHDAWQCIEMPSLDPLITPAVYVVALQLLAFYVALQKGNDIDKPRHLAKSVTV